MFNFAKINFSKRLSNRIITLRAVEPEDLDFLYKCENDMPLWAHGTNKEPTSYFALKQFINDCSKSIYENRQLRLMVVLNENKAAIGTVDLYDFDYLNSRAGIGIYIEKGSQNRGFGTEALKILTQYSFDFLNIHRLYAFVSADNLPSIKLFPKADFELVATLPKWEKIGKNFTDIKIFSKINR
jgi:diamine N-acetyltransferase